MPANPTFLIQQYFHDSSLFIKCVRNVTIKIKSSSLLDALQMVAVSRYRLTKSIIQNCFQQDRFRNTNDTMLGDKEIVLSGDIKVV